MKRIKLFEYFLSNKEKEEINKTKKVDVETIDVEKFNTWFKEEYDGYDGRGGGKGIFLRTDKLSPSMIEAYFKHLNIDSDEYKFKEKVRKNWLKKKN